MSKVKRVRIRGERSDYVSDQTRKCRNCPVNFIKLQQKVKLDQKGVSFARFRILCPRSRSQSEVKGQFKGPSDL